MNEGKCCFGRNDQIAMFLSLFSVIAHVKTRSRTPGRSGGINSGTKLMLVLALSTSPARTTTARSRSSTYIATPTSFTISLILILYTRPVLTMMCASDAENSASLSKTPRSMSAIFTVR
ncbi:hypothetical protein ElyMa_005734200 [Elysia marginata]|uniref:G-protein coupled receptors family 1 profile domain-containing protein n=1 Tax=Elysia marginata TaxID=1093978 RepID=A0AAV4FMP6_9GAST|nr:hypothetical protein ElyMa_005734200 [Elysia marginata]